MLDPLGFSYPGGCRISIKAFPDDPGSFCGPEMFPVPPGLIGGFWPPTQLQYLGLYVAELGCRTVLVEHHYVDKDYIEDSAKFHGRSLRSYPNYCQRVHFFSTEVDPAIWKAWVSSRGLARETAAVALQQGYLGYSVIRPLPGAPVGRTVLRTYGAKAANGRTRVFGAVREYEVNLAGFSLQLTGLAFQQQDQGVSACATTALWSALHKVAPMESLPSLSPGAITESASRFNLQVGRAFPSEGLTVQQLCEATRASGLSPLLVRSLDPSQARAQLHAYISSGFAPVLALSATTSGEGHAICAVGYKLGDIKPPAGDSVKFRDAASALEAVYVHDDRLGPYASAQVLPWTMSRPGEPVRIRTALEIHWPDGTPTEWSLLDALVIPVPLKLRLSVTRMRALGIRLAEGVASLLLPAITDLTLSCRYELGSRYRARASTSALSDDGLYVLNCETLLSRYVGVIELSAGGEPIIDVLLDATESGGAPTVLTCVMKREVASESLANLREVARVLGAPLLT